MCVCPAGGGGHETEPVPPVLLLPGAGGRVLRLHGALLRLPEIHQAEVQPGLVKTKTSHVRTLLFYFIYST